MERNRLILTLLLDEGILVNSHRYSLEKICEVETLLTYLDFEAIDELVILDVTRGKKCLNLFLDKVDTITRQCFLPVCVGGGIKSLEDCHRVLDSGADKVVMNTQAIQNSETITNMSEMFGKQFVVCSIDVKQAEHGEYEVYCNNGETNTFKKVTEVITDCEKKGAGEIYLRSIDRDGTQKGYDIALIRKACGSTSLPVVAAGGVGDYLDLAKGIEAGAMAVSIGKLFHFVGLGLVKAREFMRSGGANIPHSRWNYSTRHGDRLDDQIVLVQGLYNAKFQTSN